MRIFQNNSEAYLAILAEVLDNPTFKSSPRGLACREITDYQFRVLHPDSFPIITFDAERNKKIAIYTQKEKELYNSGSNKVEDFAKASKFWEKLANPDGSINSAYGYLIFNNKSHGNPSFETGRRVLPNGASEEYMRTPWEWAKLSLVKDKDTRQATLRFSLPEHQWIGNPDQTCTMHGLFLIRDNKLHLSMVMRSNDLMLGLVYDLPWFVSLIDRMVEELKSHYPELERGTYTHLSHSLHIYEKDIDAINGMLGR